MSAATDKTVGAADVDAVVATTRQRTVFELADAVRRGRPRPRALAVLSSLMGARESGVRIVAMLARHVRQLWVTQELLQADERASSKSRRRSAFRRSSSTTS